MYFCLAKVGHFWGLGTVFRHEKERRLDSIKPIELAVVAYASRLFTEVASY